MTTVILIILAPILFCLVWLGFFILLVHESMSKILNDNNFRTP